MELMKMLNASFGIGFIELNLESPASSKVLVPARGRTDLDWQVVDILIKNSGFANVVAAVNLSVQNHQPLGLEKFDKIMSEEEYSTHYEKKLKK